MCAALFGLGRNEKRTANRTFLAFLLDNKVWREYNRFVNVLRTEAQEVIILIEGKHKYVSLRRPKYDKYIINTCGWNNLYGTE